MLVVVPCKPTASAPATRANELLKQNSAHRRFALILLCMSCSCPVLPPLGCPLHVQHKPPRSAKTVGSGHASAQSCCPSFVRRRTNSPARSAPPLAPPSASPPRWYQTHIFKTASLLSMMVHTHTHTARTPRVTLQHTCILHRDLRQEPHNKPIRNSCSLLLPTGAQQKQRRNPCQPS